MGIAAFAIGCGVYIRKRVAIQRILRNGEPIAVDGWNTFPDEPEFPDIVRSQKNEAFGQFCQVSLYALLAVAVGYGFDIKADVFPICWTHNEAVGVICLNLARLCIIRTL